MKYLTILAIAFAALTIILLFNGNDVLAWLTFAASLILATAVLCIVQAHISECREVEDQQIRNERQLVDIRRLQEAREIESLYIRKVQMN